ncbi:MAG: hypothetical protein MJ078_06165 [Clostridia bacterium]|nr:hypothetical protein [Clostridia bacterium]
MIAVTEAYVIVSMIAAALYLGLALVIGGTSGLRAKGFPLNGLLGGISGVLLLGAVILLFGTRFSAIVYGIFVGVFGGFVFMTFTSMICLVRQLTYRFE